jgi:hypothetical protein
MAEILTKNIWIQEKKSGAVFLKSGITAASFLPVHEAADSFLAALQIYLGVITYDVLRWELIGKGLEEYKPVSKTTNSDNQ